MLLESLPLWVRVHAEIPLSDQAVCSGLTDRTLRRWVGGVAKPYPSSWALYLSWVTNAVLAPLDPNTFDGSASIPAGWRAFWAASPASYCLLVVHRGRVVRHEISAWPREERLEVLRARLIARVYQWGREALGASSVEF